MSFFVGQRCWRGHSLPSDFFCLCAEVLKARSVCNDRMSCVAQVNVLTGMAEMVTRSLEKDWVAKQRRESAKLLLAADLKVCPPSDPSFRALPSSLAIFTLVWHQSSGCAG